MVLIAIDFETTELELWLQFTAYGKIEHIKFHNQRRRCSSTPCRASAKSTKSI